MNNNEMVSVPLDLLCRWRHGGLTARDSAEIQRILDEGVLAAPAEECVHEFIPLRPDCVRCGEPYKAAQPVPPAGGEPEVYAYMVRKPNGSDHLDFENEYPSDAGYKISELIRREDHRARVTRLQAEVEQLQNQLRAWQALAAERLEMLTEPKPQGEPVAYRYKEGHASWENEKPWEPTTLAHGAVLLERKALAANGTFKGDERDHYLALAVEPIYASPPAPAGQFQGGPVAKCRGCNGKGSVCIDWDCGEWMDCPDCKATAGAEGYPDDPPGTIYGDEPPAPVAVVLPVRYESNLFPKPYRDGWNACLDEVSRLNPKP